MAAADGRRVRAAGGIDASVFNVDCACVVPKVAANARRKVAACHVERTLAVDGQCRILRDKDTRPARAALQGVLIRKGEVQDGAFSKRQGAGTGVFFCFVSGICRAVIERDAHPVQDEVGRHAATHHNLVLCSLTGNSKCGGC